MKQTRVTQFVVWEERVLKPSVPTLLARCLTLYPECNSRSYGWWHWCTERGPQCLRNHTNSQTEKIIRINMRWETSSSRHRDSPLMRTIRGRRLCGRVWNWYHALAPERRKCFESRVAPRPFPDPERVADSRNAREISTRTHQKSRPGASAEFDSYTFSCENWRRNGFYLIVVQLKENHESKLIIYWHKFYNWSAYVALYLHDSFELWKFETVLSKTSLSDQN